MIVSASLKNARISSQKLKSSLDAIRGLNVPLALNILMFSNKKSAFIIKKLLYSAIANAENNNNLLSTNLYIHNIYATNGPSLKRLNIRARGRSDKIIKRSSHIFIFIKERE
ncbi:MAG TPA: 50S ribosomal protein L22 [Candidatus Azoamicus sp. OHIO2]